MNHINVRFKSYYYDDLDHRVGMPYLIWNLEKFWKFGGKKHRLNGFRDSTKHNHYLFGKPIYTNTSKLIL